MTAKTITIEAPEQLLLPVSELPHGRMFVQPDKLDQLSMVVTDIAGAYHTVDLKTGCLYPMDTQSLINVHPVDKFTATITLR